MQTSIKWTKVAAGKFSAVALVLAAVATLSCSKEEAKPERPAAPNAQELAPPPPSAASDKLSPGKIFNIPTPECPAGCKGEGVFSSPCEATGNARMMDVVWTGKIDDKGLFFDVTNKSDSAILFGKIAVYFYDKAGKQLNVPAASGSSRKPKPFYPCARNMLGGVMKPGEKAVLLSCVKKEHVPEGTKAIEAEMQMVGFADASEKSVEYYWRNNDLTPETRKKGGKK
jgi:hypothetical protein